MEIQFGYSELSVISQVSAVEGCPLSGVPLYYNILYNIMHAACHAMTDLKFRSCTVLSSSSPVIEASKPVTVKVESWSQIPISVIEAPALMWLVDGVRTILMTFTIVCTIRTICSYWGLLPHVCACAARGGLSVICQHKKLENLKI